MDYTSEEHRRWRIGKIQRLPSLAFRHRRYLPDIPAVYFVFNEESELLYVGKACNLLTRWRDHHRAPQMRDDYRIYWWEISREKERAKIEFTCILRLRPLWNYQRVTAEKAVKLSETEE